MKLNDWALAALKERGIEVTKTGKIRIAFHKGKVQEVNDLPTALRQQQHIVDQQREEQKENEAIGLLMRKFHEVIMGLEKMTIEEFTTKRKNSILSKLEEILIEMSRKREDLRKDGYERLKKVYKMLEKNNLPAAHLASQASLDRMRKRWMVNEKVIDKSIARLEALKNLANVE